MQRLSFVILMLFLSAGLFAQKSPHGDSFRANCDDCHKTDSWKVNLKTITFDHGETKFPLVGQHQVVACKDCHSSLEFAKTQKECNACHTDIHEQTVGNECSRCHTPNSWIVTNITQLHQRSRFPLLGAHTTAECKDCHTNLVSSAPSKATVSLLRFDPLGVNCYDCHNSNYQNTTKPNHVLGNYSKNCTECHNINSISWSGAGINHNFFPLEGGHSNTNCTTCHTSGSFSKIPADCASCHSPDYQAAKNPSHNTLGFSKNCKECHSLSPGWKPADYKDHDTRLFPIYSGKHKGEWDKCSDCHTNGSTYSSFSCIDCHEHNQSDMNKKHSDVSGYTYKSTACYSCHPSGSGEGSFDHSKSKFPLTGAHTSADCSSCHSNGYVGTTTSCASCHTKDYAGTTNPKHTEIGVLSNDDCSVCHTSNPDWKPATFSTHDKYYKLEGAHVPIANDCASCHKGNYVNSPNTCYGCHSGDYNKTTKPNHVALKFATSCIVCHSQTAWTPSKFNHSAVYPLTGAHSTIAENCLSCHTNGYVSTPNTCAGCHQNAYTQSVNPNHTKLNLPTDCASCHTTKVGWEPASFPNHNVFYKLEGAHVAISADCAACHKGNYVNSPNTCFGCHSVEYSQTLNPAHSVAQFPTTCAECHTQSAWTPSTFNHDVKYFSIYSGNHKGEWNACKDCHTNASSFAQYSCVDCHEHNQADMNSKHKVVSGYQYNSSACFSCHPKGSKEGSFNHSSVGFPLEGGHSAVSCINCHANGYTGTSKVCSSCHSSTYDQASNPNHKAIGINSDCSTCHTTSQGWEPAKFPTHNNYYKIEGAHIAVANDCASCHKGNYVNSPNTCYGCHSGTYNQTTKPNHVTSQFSTTCQTCHSQSAWIPSTFNHAAIYPFTGAHTTIAENCKACHPNGYTNTPNTCAGCHQSNYSQSINPSHTKLNLPTDCASCHTTNPGWEPSRFPTHNNYYKIEGAHIAVANDCASCHKGNYVNSPNTCYGCHSGTYNQTTKPNHVTSQFSTICQTCHSQSAWIPSTFNHAAVYPFTGAHTTIAENCNACHTNGYINTPNTCAGCHQSNYSQSINPSHTKLNLPTDCASCHTTNPGWEPAKFPTHNNYYKIEGAHIAVANDCASCHKGNYVNSPNTCYGCHADTYNQTTKPNHVTSQFSTTCQTCHSQSAWIPSTFNHAAIYPFTGAHTTIAENCKACHTNGYINTPNTCAGCHQGNYNQSINPSHTKLNLPTDCASCHTTNPGWEPAKFPIHNNYYKIEGAHIAVANECASCHKGNYVSTPNTCYGCHTTDYSQTTNPSHSAAQFPTTCASCHSQSAWTPSTFNHDGQYFPIYSGKHRGEWTNCNECHTTAGNFKQFSCINCHEHNQTDMNNKHKDVRNYTYASSACYSCHPKGSSD